MGKMSEASVREMDEEEYDTEDEEEVEEGQGFFEWMSDKVSSSSLVQKVSGATGKVLGGGKYCGLIGLKVTWVVLSSSIIVGIPFMLAVDGERNVLEMQNQMAAQQGQPQGATGAGGVPMPAPPVAGQ
jgi:hypothetical protein